MRDYSNGRDLDFRIAKEIVRLDVIAGTFTYLESCYPQAVVREIPHYSSNDAATEQLIATLRAAGWTVEAIAGGTLSQHGKLLKSGVGYFVEYPRRRSKKGHVVIAGDLCSAASAIMRAADIANGHNHD